MWKMSRLDELKTFWIHVCCFWVTVHMSIFCLFNSTGRFLTTFLRLKNMSKSFNQAWSVLFFWPWKGPQVWLPRYQRHLTVGSASLVTMTPLGLTPWWQRHLRVWLPGDNDTLGSDSLVTRTPLGLTPSWQWHQRGWHLVKTTPWGLTLWWQRHHWVWLPGDIGTIGSDSLVTLRSQNCWTSPQHCTVTILIRSQNHIRFVQK